MKLVTDIRPGVIGVAIQGRFDAHTVGGYLAEVTERIDADHATVVMARGGVDFMDSSALAALVPPLKRPLKHGGVVVFPRIAPAAQIILDLPRLDGVFTRRDDVSGPRHDLAV